MKGSTKVTFFQVDTPAAKLAKICQVATEYFEKREPLLIKVPTKEALEYIDLLLWRLPKESFLPHLVSDTPTDELIVITTSDQNPNQARSIFNLTPSPIPNENQFFTSIYELEDTSSPQKAATTKQAYQTYKAREYALISF